MLENILKKTNFTDVLIIIIASLAIVGIWRGVWGLMDIYLLPENSTLSFFVSIATGLAILFAIAFYGPEKNKKSLL